MFEDEIYRGYSILCEPRGWDVVSPQGIRLERSIPTRDEAAKFVNDEIERTQATVERARGTWGTLKKSVESSNRKRAAD